MRSKIEAGALIRASASLLKMRQNLFSKQIQRTHYLIVRGVAGFEQQHHLVETDLRPALDDARASVGIPHSSPESMRVCACAVTALSAALEMLRFVGL